MRSFRVASLLTLSLLSASLMPVLRAQTAEVSSAEAAGPVEVRAANAQTIEAQAVADGMPGQLITSGGMLPMLLPVARPMPGAPFSASFTAESRQQLADGSYIFKNQTGKIARDTQGRTYNELTRTMSPSMGSRTFTTININDRVAGVQLLLNVENHTARRFVRPSSRPLRAPGDGPLTTSTAGASAMGTVTGNPEGGATTTTTRRTAPLVPRDSNAGPRPQIEKQDLGTESMEGLIVNHYLQTQTIPAGEIGNERELIVTTEVWYSRDLRLNVKQIRKDPRFGEETFTLTELERDEPPASLFEIPEGYTVTEAPLGAVHSITVPAGTTGVAATGTTEQPQR